MIIEKEKTLEPCPFCGQLPTTKVEVTQMGGNKDQINFLIYCPDCRYVRMEYKVNTMGKD